MSPRGRPRNLFGLTSEQYRAWQSGREWSTEPWQLLKEGSAVGTNLNDPRLRIEFTQLSLDDQLFWLSVQAVDGKNFNSPVPLAQSDISALLEEWGMTKFTWAEGKEMTQATFRGTVPREFIVNPGPYWYLTSDLLNTGTWVLRCDKQAFTSHAHQLAFVIGPTPRYFGDVNCNDLPDLNVPFTLGSKMNVVTAMARGAANWARLMFLRSERRIRPFDSWGVRAM